MGLRSIIVFGLSVLMLDLSAQTKDFQEEVHLSVNATNVLVGETMHFSAFVYSNKTKRLSELSSLLYVELIDEEGNPLHQTKIGLRGGRGSGSIAINPEWSSNTYRIVAYTRWMRNYKSFFEQKILILNPYTGLTNNYEISGDPQRAEESHQGQTYAPLQRVSMNMGTIDPATLSITVFEKPDLFYSNEIHLENSPVSMDGYEILPDYKYGLVQGHIKEAAGDFHSKRINMTVKGEFMQVATTKTDEYGRFWMTYNPEIASNDAAIQIQCEGDSIELEVVSEFFEGHTSMKNTRTTLDSMHLTNMVSRSIHSQIQYAYLEPGQQEPSGKHVYSSSKETIVYYLDEYKRFTSMRDTFIELTIHIGASKSEESDNLFVRCEQPPGLTATNRSPLILLDGLSVDAQTILNHNPNEIEKIEVLPAYYFVGDLVYKGLISAHTFDGSAPTTLGNTYPLSEYQPYSEEGFHLTISENLPHYESNVLWQPIYDHQGGRLLLDFSTSRLEGNYQVLITGITNSGKPVNISRTFQVAATHQ